MDVEHLFPWLIGAAIAQRLTELGFARRNARWIRDRGGFEVGAEHYPWIVLLHVSFFAGMILEVRIRDLGGLPVWWPALGVFALAQGMRIWCLVSLGRYWNTRVFVVPGHPPVRRGPYRRLRHPNYLVVMIELVSLPLSFHAHWTALWASMFNAPLIALRIRVEEDALRHPARTSFSPRGGAERIVPVATSETGRSGMNPVAVIAVPSVESPSVEASTALSAQPESLATQPEHSGGMT